MVVWRNQTFVCIIKSHQITLKIVRRIFVFEIILREVYFGFESTKIKRFKYLPNSMAIAVGMDLNT